MDALLDEMYMAQVGETPGEAAEEAAAAIASEDSDSDSDDDAQALPPSSSTTLSSSSSSSIWRPDVKPPKDALRHAKAHRQGHTRASPDLSLEILRHNAVGNLTCFFLNKVNRGLEMDLRIPPFERWLFSQHRVDGSDDPVLPDPRLEEEHAKAGRSLLRRELVEGGASKSSAEKVLTDLNKTAIKLLGQVQRASVMVSTVTSVVDVKGRVPLIQVRFDAGRKLYQLMHKSTTVTVNQAHYEKLQVLHARFGGQQQQQQQHARKIDVEEQEKKRFHHRLFLLLLRYSSLAGGTERGGGFQGAINEEAFEVLLRRFDCRMECFASPLNCRYPHYCSAFDDTDGCFGSLGSFFSFSPREGMYEANPPFLPCVIERMAKHMEDLLQTSERPLGFVVVIPAWKDEEAEGGEEGKEGGKEHPAVPKEKASRHQHRNNNKTKDKKRPKAIYTASGASWRRLRESPFCVRHVLLQAQQHGYVEGSQHKLPTRFKTSYFDTSVFVLQNEGGREAWPVTEEVVWELERACKSKHEAETAARRGGGGGGSEGGMADKDEEEELEVEIGQKEEEVQEQPRAEEPRSGSAIVEEQDAGATQRKKKKKKRKKEGAEEGEEGGKKEKKAAIKSKHD